MSAFAHMRVRRRAAVLVIALVCLSIAMALIGSLFQSTLRARRQLRVERDRRQTELLLDLGTARARQLAATQPGDPGLTWQLPSETVVGHGDATVTIEAVGAPADRVRKFQVVAEYPVGSALSIRRSRTVTVLLQE